MEAKRTAFQLLEAKGLQYINAQKLFPISAFSRGSEGAKSNMSTAAKLQFSLDYHHNHIRQSYFIYIIGSKRLKIHQRT
jgi:hypothetical protein